MRGASAKNKTPLRGEKISPYVDNMLVIDVLDLDLLILMSDPESGATLTAIGIDRFSAVCSSPEQHFYLQRRQEIY